MDDSGFTLVELMVTSTVLLLLMGMVFVTVSMIEDLGTGVSSQYQALNEALPALTPFHSLVSSEIEPAPPTGGVPTPPFLASVPVPQTSQGLPSAGIFPTIGNFGFTFYTNVGTAYDNSESCPSGQTCTTGTTAGPAMIVAVELDPSGNEVTSATSCTSSAPCSYQMRMYLPETGISAPGVSSCPGVGTGPYCIYPSTYRLLANVQDVVNNPSNVNAQGAPVSPLFTYTLFDIGSTTLSLPARAITLTSTEVANQTITGLTQSAVVGSPVYPVDTQSLSACAAPVAGTYPTLAVSCPADAIQSVSIDLQVAAPGSGMGGGQESNLVVYRYAQSPGSTTAPYQYSATVG
jgi:prepilin-type N-terminal cleavage/methylation domain-containing protein